MKDVITTYNGLNNLAKENAIRSTRNSINYADYVLHELNERAEGLFYDKFEVDTDTDVAEINIAFKKHCADFSTIPESDSLFDKLNVSLFIVTAERFDNLSEQLIEQAKIHSSFKVNSNALKKVADFDVVATNGRILCNVESFADVELSLEEKNEVESWMCDIFGSHIYDIRKYLVGGLRSLYSSRKINEYLERRNPEFFEDGRIVG